VSARLIALYHQPDDPAAFDAYYQEVHAPIVRRYPGLRDLRLTRTDTVGGTKPSIHLMAEMIFNSRAELEAALASEPGRESGRDLRNFAGAGVTLLIAEDGGSNDA
jgi:uncharacterized protein (TIGR02118 family)